MRRVTVAFLSAVATCNNVSSFQPQILRKLSPITANQDIQMQSPSLKKHHAVMQTNYLSTSSGIYDDVKQMSSTSLSLTKDSQSTPTVDVDKADEVNKDLWKGHHKETQILALSTILMSWLASGDAAYAAGPDWGLFEGRTGSLLHPITMGGLFLFSLYTGYLGLQWKRQRTIGDEISQLKKEAAAITPSSTDATEVPQSPALAAIEAQVKSLQDERKRLAESNPRDKHFAQGAVLAFLGTAFAIEGPLNTYARAGKLFPGPHLYVGAGLVVLWSLAVATVPSMQKGNDIARKIHVGSNIVGVSLFGWQVVTGLPILFKVWEKTSWP